MKNTVSFIADHILSNGLKNYIFSALVATSIKSEIPAKCFTQYCKTPRVYSSLHIGEIHSYEFMNWYYVQYSQNGDRGVFNITQRPQLSTSTSQPSIELHQPRTASPAGLTRRAFNCCRGVKEGTR